MVSYTCPGCMKSLQLASGSNYCDGCGKVIEFQTSLALAPAQNARGISKRSWFFKLWNILPLFAAIAAVQNGAPLSGAFVLLVGLILIQFLIEYIWTKYLAPAGKSFREEGLVGVGANINTKIVHPILYGRAAKEPVDKEKL